MTNHSDLKSVGAAASLHVALEREGFDVGQARKIADLAASCKDLHPHVERVLRLCESPIERSFLLALLRDDQPLVIDTEWLDRQLDFHPGIPLYGTRGGLTVVWIWPQYSVTDEAGVMRCDFGLELYRNGLAAAICVELDGHDWHEKTRKQAACDKARDRRLLCSGYPVLRFTGSEIWSNPVRCAAQAILALLHAGHPRCAGQELSQ